MFLELSLIFLKAKTNRALPLLLLTQPSLKSIPYFFYSMSDYSIFIMQSKIALVRLITG